LFLIPDGYKGTVVVFFDIPNGKPIKFMGKSRVYEIDSNGVLLTQFKQNIDVKPSKNVKYYYFIRKGNSNKELPYVDKDEFSKFTSEKIIVFAKTMENGLSDKNHKQYNYLNFIVGKLGESDSLYQQREKTHLPNSLN
jgi:hypothetical protein